ncbi:hypothetical protein niasHT_038989 [Heterodera trifolii]|uniref:Peptidase A1 domain-containing protein n=1 Tax=Heterodera trifolii TaxID=157864 RepID=A0ABD2I907_9BILA
MRALRRVSAEARLVENGCLKNEKKWLELGTPPQEFTVQLDTGSGDFWVLDSTCGKNGCYKGCTSNDAQWCNAQCDPKCCGQNGGGGTTAKQPVPTVKPAAQFPGFRHAETEEPPSCQNLSKFESQKSASYQETDMTFSIEYGVGFAAGLIGQDFVQAYKQGLFEKPLFSLYLATQGKVNGTLGGVLTLGDVDDENCAPITNWIPITHNSSGFWEFQLDKITLDDGTPINVTSAAMVDSGTSFMIGPFDEVNNILRHYGVDPEKRTMPCDQKFGPIIFTIQVDEKTLLFDQGNGTCIVGLTTLESIPSWLLGDPFCREYCQIHDVEKKQIHCRKR